MQGYHWHVILSNHVIERARHCSLLNIQCWYGCHDSSCYHTWCRITAFHSADLRQFILHLPLQDVQVQARELKMGYSTTSIVFMLTLLMGMVKEDGTTAAGLSGKAKPDWKGVEELLKNISGSRRPGKINVKYSVKMFLSQP